MGTGGARILVLNFEEPRQRLLGWFLRDSGISCDEVASAEAACAAVASGRTPVVVVNTLAMPDAIVAAVEQLRAAAPRDIRIVVLHDGRHVDDDVPIPADVCIHDVSDPDRLIEVVKAAIADDVPETEPHEAAEEIVES